MKQIEIYRVIGGRPGGRPFELEEKQWVETYLCSIEYVMDCRGNNGIKLVIPIIPLTEKRMCITECVKNKMEFY